jgi:hypothetical protein
LRKIPRLEEEDEEEEQEEEEAVVVEEMFCYIQSHFYC